MQRHGQLGGDPALDFLTSRINFERTWSVSYSQRDFRLDRMRQLLDRLGNPQDELAIVHVAGTKGKGSTAAMIASVLSAAGFRTGLYTSPHLDRVEERLIVGGAISSAAELADLVEHVRPAVAAMDAQPADGGSNRPTYFEVITALALVHFARSRVDAAVLEVGLGGRLDSTNVCEPVVSVITSISFDHTQQLGTTLALIAAEKAGIVKFRKPLVSGVVQSEPRDVVTRAAQAHQCPLVQLGIDFEFNYHPPRHLETAPSPGHMDFRYRAFGMAYELGAVALGLTGHHQAANAAVGIATLTELVRQGLAEVRWPARVEVVRRVPTVVLDSAHNVASIEALVRSLDESFVATRRLLIFATTRDKDARGMLEVLLAKFDDVILTRYWSNPRGMPIEELEALSAELSGRRAHVCADPAAACKLAGQIAGSEHLICITGSFFIAAEMRAAMQADR
jgi:dihydrofolate synthase / folylpolyglutamate synthase